MSRGESRLTDMEMRETAIPTFPPLALCIYPSKKKRPNKTFIIPGKVFNVFDIKRLKGRRDEITREEKDRVEGGERWRLKKSKDRKLEVRKPVRVRPVKRRAGGKCL